MDGERAGQTYGPLVVGGHARVHQGNVINYYNATQSAEDSNAARIRNALFLTDPELDRASLITAKGERADGTCEWILEDTTFKSWTECKTGTLWISGGPGKGKTMMSIFLTEYLARRPGPKSIYYFCVSQDEKRNTAAAVLRGLLFQMLRLVPRTAIKFKEYFGSSEQSSQSLASAEALWKMFTVALGEPELDGCWFIIDGLDECDEESIAFLTSKLAQLAKLSSSSRLKVLIVSRPRQQGLREFDQQGLREFDQQGLREFDQIRLDPDNDSKIETDIEKFVSLRLEELKHISGADEASRRVTRKALLDRAEGTFL